MEFNRLISLVLGFVVLILAFVWISNRFRANKTTTQSNQPTITITPTTAESEQNDGWNPFAFLFNKKTLTPTLTGTSNNTKPSNKDTTSPRPKTQVTIIERKNNNVISRDTTTRTNNTNNTYNQKSVQQIPETGTTTSLLPILSLLLAGGFAIRKSS